MPSDGDLARSISEFKDEFRSGLSSLKRELAQEHDNALKKLKKATCPTSYFADDSDDDKRIRQAEARASQKRRRAQAKKSSSFRLQKPSTPPVSSLPYVVSGYGTPASPSYPAVSLPGSNFSNPFGAVNWPKAHRGSRDGSCFACGSFGHFRNRCPFLQAQFSASQPGKRT